jgi:hypothetical protein
MMKSRLAILVLPIALLAGPAAADTIQVGSAAALTATDFIDWGQVRVLDTGGSAVAKASPLGVTSNQGLSASISDGSAFTGLVEGTDWFGNFNVGDNVLYTGDAIDPTAYATAFTIEFATAVGGLGLQITPADYLDFGASLEVFNGATSLGLFTVTGANLGAGDGTAPFLGALTDGANITRAIFTLTSNADAGLGVNRLLLAGGSGTTPPPPNPVPEPGTLSLVIIGAAGMVARRRLSLR